jgi:hypothetical protein
MRVRCLKFFVSFLSAKFLELEIKFLVMVVTKHTVLTGLRKYRAIIGIIKLKYIVVSEVQNLNRQLMVPFLQF